MHMKIIQKNITKVKFPSDYEKDSLFWKEGMEDGLNVYWNGNFQHQVIDKTRAVIKK